jgi:integrase/recombinase XerD
MTRVEAVSRRKLLSNAIADYCRRYLVPGSNTARAKRSDFIHFLDFLGDKIVLDITPADVESFRIKCVFEGEAPATIARRLATLRHFFRKIKIDISIPKVFIEIPEINPVSDETFLKLKLFAQRSSDFICKRNIAIASLLRDSGMRISEALSLDVAQFAGDRFRSVRCKGLKVRDIYIPNTALSYIQTWLEKRQNVAKCGAFFVSESGTRLCYASIHDWFTRASSELGQRLNPHRFRHTFGKSLYLETKDIELTRHALGHSSIVTSQRYARSNAEEWKNAINGLARKRLTILRPDSSDS